MSLLLESTVAVCDILIGPVFSRSLELKDILTNNGLTNFTKYGERYEKCIMFNNKNYCIRDSVYPDNSIPPVSKRIWYLYREDSSYDSSDIEEINKLLTSKKNMGWSKLTYGINYWDSCTPFESSKVCNFGFKGKKY
jgi:hypothetical protein